ncbi:glycoside hydrolase family 16 protein [Fistulina hepatica ATCC 64428]|uniref:Glycoside hydrolase family 16 protein n=1 Tax=Fistulina hepatica ATCC 64428 TaxID=1128425 RepID=A0A0D7A6F3_9AGAR|nr:glycoside hydrolase family 16 protein [Fistulina hepatica ATCC 64428]
MSTTRLLAYQDQHAAPPQAPYMRASARYSSASTISDKFSLSPDPTCWGSPLDNGFPEPDDYLHNVDPRRDHRVDSGGIICTARGVMNLGCLAVLLVTLLALFLGYPVASYYATKVARKSVGATATATQQPMGLNASGEYPSFIDAWRLIDPDTPDGVKTKTGYQDDSTFTLIFSDEFNLEGRSFYPGDDPYWEALDLYNWATDDLEYYTPAAINTSDGALHITLSKTKHVTLDYESGMLQSWNKFCFTGGLIEASIRLPGNPSVSGLWPAFWTMGNLGRSGYGATLDGMWPYTYDSCDVGTLPNQTLDGKPTTALTSGSSSYNGTLSYLPGQRLSRCTCEGESHPGPKHSDGTFVGRSAPEIDVFEAQVWDNKGAVSQSGQWAPFDKAYVWHNTSETYHIVNSSNSILNSYLGGVYQEASSVISYTNQSCYEVGGTGCFSTYAIEYKPGFDDAYISWIADDTLQWTLYVAGVAADEAVEISARPVPQEPMYMLINLAFSSSFTWINYDELVFPTTMSVDYVRVYQKSDSINYGCDPADFPTAAYISTYAEAYADYNLTTWVDDYGQTIPKNNLTDDCST